MSGRRMFWGVAAGFALTYLVWVLASRDPAVVRWRRSQPRALIGYPGTGGNGVRILQFYASTGQIVDGESATVCYGVDNARAVRFEPAGEQLKPTWNRCFSVSPSQDTTYTLVADGADGNQATASFTVRVKPAAPFIKMFAASQKEIRRGDRFSMCYETEHAVSIRVEPVGMKLNQAAGCVMFQPNADMEFRLVATGVDGRTDQAKVRMRVH